MASKQQQLFAKIVLHNKLLKAPEVEQLMRQFAEPEEVIQHLIATGKLNEKTGSELRGLYEKQLEKLGIPCEKVTAIEAPQADPADIDSLVEEALEDEHDPETPVDVSSPADSTSADSRTDRIQVDLGEEAEAPVIDDAEEDLPVLERDTQSDERPVRIEAPSASGTVDSKSKELIHDILREAREMKASDVHITAGLAPMVRQAGSLKTLDRPPLPPEVTEGGLLAMLDEGRRAQFVETNDLDFCYDGGEELGRFRTNFLREQSGVDGVFRLIDTVVPSFEQLGLPEQIQRFTDYAVGIVLITGPKGSGKTTTLAAMVDLLNESRQEHMILIEDPIEYVHKNKKCHINQREVGTHTKTFGNALRAALREAPDIIVVGEMRDLETTSLAISAAETGHLVLATLHTPDAIRTIGRVLDVFPPEEQGQIRAMLSESLRGIVSQQLIPNKEGSALELALEILVNTSAIGNMIREDRTFQLRGIMQTGRKQGMTLLDDSLIGLVREGRISKEEAFLRATEVEYVQKELD